MAAIANAIDFFVGECLSTRKCTSTLVSNQTGLTPLLTAIYALSFVFCLTMQDYSWVPGLRIYGFMYFVGAVLQFLAFVCLTIRVKHFKSVEGISSQSLAMFAISLSARVMATSIYDGYLPSDSTADFMLQTVDAGSLAVVAYLLFLVHKTYVHTYQADQDTLPALPVVAACLVCACWIHPDLNRNFLMDSMWSFSLNVEVFQMLPQLYMLAKVGGLVDNVTVHYVVLIFLAAVCRIVFWVWAVPGCDELSSGKGFHGMLLGGYYVLTCYVIEICIHLDFVYYCVKSWWKGDKGVSLPKLEELQ